MQNPVTYIKNKLSFGARVNPGTAKGHKNLSNYITPVQLQRIKTDIQLWRTAVAEAELAYFPFRVKMQRIFIDTVLNEHVLACVKTRKQLTLLREFMVCGEDGVEDADATSLLKAQWFSNFLSYVLDANFYGYSLIALGDIENNAFPRLSFVRRWNISPDRLNVAPFDYSMAGQDFTADPYKDWHVWVPTPTDNGVSSCGYGLFYTIAKTEIYLRNNTAFNADFIQTYGQPIRKGITGKVDETERGLFEQALAKMGHDAYILLDAADEVELIEPKGTGDGYASYADFEKRLEAKISKLLLGHADALDSTPGRLGSIQNVEASRVSKALWGIQAEDAKLCENIVNNELMPRLIKFGFPIAPGSKWKLKNNKEQQQERELDDASNQVTAGIFNTITQAGGEPDWDYFTQRTGIKVRKSEKSESQ